MPTFLTQLRTFFQKSHVVLWLLYIGVTAIVTALNYYVPA